MQHFIKQIYVQKKQVRIAGTDTSNRVHEISASFAVFQGDQSISSRPHYTKLGKAGAI